jgi:hypothetical protein
LIGTNKQNPIPDLSLVIELTFDWPFFSRREHTCANESIFISKSNYLEMSTKEFLMKFTVYFKTPDAMHYAIEEAIEWVGYEDDQPPTDSEAAEEEKYKITEAMNAVAEKFMKYGEVITVEFDTEAKTATVLKV